LNRLPGREAGPPQRGQALPVARRNFSVGATRKCRLASALYLQSSRVTRAAIGRLCFLCFVGGNGFMPIRGRCKLLDFFD